MPCRGQRFHAGLNRPKIPPGPQPEAHRPMRPTGCQHSERALSFPRHPNRPAGPAMPMRILIADDNHFYRRALEMTLREWGYEVLAVSDGQTAWDVLQSDQAPKLAILDWMMPGLDGLEVCRRLRAVSRHEPTYVIILTSKDGKEHAIAALDSGADDYVRKPFDRDELRARLRVGRRIVGLQTCETVVYSFARAVDAKSPYTRGHSERVTRYALALAERLGLPPADIDVVRRGGLLHDIGKICIPD